MSRKMEMLTRINNDGKLRKKYDNNKSNAIKSNVDFLLTFDQYVDLLKQAGLTSSRLSKTHDENYVLSRISKQGAFTVDNCRFTVCRKPTLTSHEHSQRIKEGLRYHTIARQLIAALIRDSNLTRMDQRYVGVKNGQYGSFWLTDGITNKKWRPAYGDIPEGFRRGRI